MQAFGANNEIKYKDVGWGYRHQQCLILFWIFAIAHCMNSCIGVSLVVMTHHNNHQINTTNNTGNNSSMEFKPNGVWNSLILVPPYPTFSWTKKEQDTVIAAFYWGNFLLQIPAGHVVNRIGVRYIFILAMTLNFIALILMPTVTYYGSWYATATCRFAQGISQACIIPGLHTALGKWIPLHERGRLGAFVYGGQAFGTVLGIPLTGFIAASPMGWPGIFRFYGALSGIMTAATWFLLFDTPSIHPKISYLEKKYIEDDLGPGDKEKIVHVPWSKILRHKGVYAILFAQIAGAWGHLTLYSEVPAYMDKIMGVNIKANGLLTALPFFAMWLSNFFFSWFTDWLVVKNILSVTNTRKLANSLGYVPAGIGLIILAYVPLNIYVVETLLVIICSFKIAAHCGYLINHIDISPNYAGALFSLTTAAATIGTSISPILAGLILTDVSDKYLWRNLFFLTAAVYLVTNLVYVILGTSDRAEWNDPVEEDSDEHLSMLNKPQ